MIIGECPYCENVIVNAMPDRSPAYCRPTCETCGKTYWLRCSRISSVAYTEEEFERLHEIDAKNRSIKPRQAPESAPVPPEGDRK